MIGVSYVKHSTSGVNTDLNSRWSSGQRASVNRPYVSTLTDYRQCVGDKLPVLSGRSWLLSPG